MLYNLFTGIIYLFSAIVSIMIPVKLTHYLCNVKKIKINRWIIGGVSPLFLIVPKIIFGEIPSIIWGILLFLFIESVVMFFELSRMMIDNKQVKGLIDYSKYIKNDDKSKGKKKRRSVK
ncbi:hypothetical protein [Clostridium hydrogeniformans]|uniref:hypothetical protein n=1 Tax=Clostridium hydrogeniformans TaxID=349933 RepID=UPI00047FD5EF|nr:hypothetical protein [Clostridium hydrogeniformans]